jgi:hypothetical protein
MNRLTYDFVFTLFLSLNEYWRNKLFACETAEKCWPSVDHTASTTPAATTSVYMLVTYFRIFMESNLCIWAVSSPAISRVNVELLCTVSEIMSVPITVVHRMSDEASVVFISQSMVTSTRNDGYGDSFRNVRY